MDYLYIPIAFGFYSPFGQPPTNYSNSVLYNGSPEVGGSFPTATYSLTVNQTLSEEQVLVWLEFGITNAQIVATNVNVTANASAITAIQAALADLETSSITYDGTTLTELSLEAGDHPLNTVWTAVNTKFTSVDAAIAAISAGVSLSTLNTTLANFVTDFVTGIGYTSDSGLIVTLASGTASIGGQYTAFAGGTITVTGTKDNWIYLNQSGALQFIAVTINASQPATPAGTIVLWKATTNSSAVTGHTDERNTTPFTASQISGLGLTVGATPITSGNDGYVLYNNSGVLANDTIPSVLGYTPENVANKATSFGTLNNTLYPTTSAVNTKINSAISAALTPYQPIQKTVTNVNFGISPYTVLSTDQQLNIDCTGGAITINLPTPAVGNAGQSLYLNIGLGDITSHAVTLQATGGANVRGNPTYVWNTANSDLIVTSNGLLYTGLGGN